MEQHRGGHAEASGTFSSFQKHLSAIVTLLGDAKRVVCDGITYGDGALKASSLDLLQPPTQSPPHPSPGDLNGCRAAEQSGILRTEQAA